MKINFTNIEETKEFIPLSEGEYNSIISNATMEVSKKGDPMVKVEFKILGIEENRKIIDFIVLTNEISLGKLKTILRLSGFDMSQEIDVEYVTKSAMLIGKQMPVFVAIEDYVNDKGRNIVSNKIKYVVSE